LFVKSISHAFPEFLVSEPSLLDGINIRSACFGVTQGVLIEKRKLLPLPTQPVYRIRAFEFAFFKRGKVFILCRKVVDFSRLNFMSSAFWSGTIRKMILLR